MKGLIVSAGKNTRFGSEKALSKINDVPLVLDTYLKMSEIVNDLFVSIRQEKYDDYKKVLPEAEYVCLDKSAGNGQAIKDSLEQLVDDTYVIVWGDMYFNNFNFVPSQLNTKQLNVFVQAEENPYVTYELSLDNIVQKVNFPNECQYKKIGWQDKGVFIADKNVFLQYLNNAPKNNKNELDLLYAIEHNKKFATNAVVLHNAGIYSFNTPNEYFQLKELIENG